LNVYEVDVLYGEITLKFLRAEIGVAMSIVSYILLWVVSIGYLRSVFVFCVLAGMALYVSDRKGFLNRRSGDKDTAVGLAILGLALIVIDSFLGVFVLSWMGLIRSVSRSWTWKNSMIEASYLAFFGLVFLFSGLLFFDGIGARFDIWSRPLPLKQGIDFEEAWKECPKALFDRYVRHYPHNPEGVLEWHIHKKMKEGKTREQAIKELMHALFHS